MCVEWLGEAACGIVLVVALHTNQPAALEAVNAARAEVGVGPLRQDTSLGRIATRYVVQMANLGCFGHDCGSTLQERGQWVGWRDWLGENLGINYREPEAVVEGYLNSPSHRDNLLNPYWNRVGIGHVELVDGRTYYAHEFGRL